MATENKITVFTDIILEKTTPLITADLLDESDNPIDLNDIITLTLTYYCLSDTPTNTIINSRNEQNVLNTNNVFVTNTGALSWYMQEADTTMTDSTLKEVIYRAVFKWTYTTAHGTRTGRHVLDMTIFNLEKLI